MNLANIKILHIDSNHPLLWEQLQQAGFTNYEDFTSSKAEIEAKIQDYQGVVIRSRFKIDKTFNFQIQGNYRGAENTKSS